MRTLSLFSGCGGMDIGFEGGFRCLVKSVNKEMHPDWLLEEDSTWGLLKPTDFQIVFANDIRDYAKAAWCSYFSNFYEDPGLIYKLESIVDYVKQVKAGIYEFPKDIDLVLGGFPCQDFSIAGKRKGFESNKNHLGKLLDGDQPSIESRGNLYMWMREVISITKPKMFIAENVKGIANLAQVKDIIERDFSTAAGNGYLVVPAKILNAANYGVPQSRERVFFIGLKKSALKTEAHKALTQKNICSYYDPYPPQTHGENLHSFVTCRDALVGLDEPENSSDPSQKKYSGARYMGSHCQGQTEIKLDAPSPTIRSEHHGNIEFRRLSLEHGGVNEDELNRGMKERRLTVRECARLQTFPDNYQFILPKRGDYAAVSASSAYKVIGNAVPCVLAYHLARNIQMKWFRYFKEV